MSVGRCASGFELKAHDPKLVEAREPGASEGHQPAAPRLAAHGGLSVHGRRHVRPLREEAPRRPSFLTNYIEAEAHALRLRKLGRTVARQWLLTGGLPVVSVLPAEEQRAKEMLARHVDKDWTLCDAISFAVLDARRVRRAFTFDHHFRQYGRVHVLGLA